MSLSDHSALPDPRIERVRDENHAWLVGQLFGAVLRFVAEEDPTTSEVEMIDFPDGAHAATFRITRPSGPFLVSVVRE